MRVSGFLVLLCGCLPELPPAGSDPKGDSATDTAAASVAGDIACDVAGTGLSVHGQIDATVLIEKVSITIDASAAVFAEYPNSYGYGLETTIDGTAYADGTERTAAVWVRLEGEVDAVTLSTCAFIIPTPCADADGDGQADVACGGTDCDDTADTVYQGAAETCNDVDDDCDLETDESAIDVTAWYLDSDADAHGDAAVTVMACDEPANYVAAGDDCDDQNTAVHPGAEETECADPVDYNCDGSVGYADVDEDGWAACLECDDTDGSVRPDAIEICNDLDDDCDTEIDEPDAFDALTWYADADTDTYGDATSTTLACQEPSGYVADDTDCNDLAADVHPGVIDICDLVDGDCDGTVDEDPNEVYFLDGDGDGYGDGTDPTYACGTPTGYSGASTDCDDADGTAYPGAAETCDDVDDDCDGTADDGLTLTTYFADADGDGYGDAALSASDCAAPSGYVASDDDCDDLDDTVYPTAAEVCDLTDDDCDGLLTADCTDLDPSAAGAFWTGSAVDAHLNYGRVVGDLNADGYDDILLHQGSSVYVVNGAAGGPVSGGTAAAAADATWTLTTASVADAADLDADGDLDLIVGDYSGEVYVSDAPYTGGDFSTDASATMTSTKANFGYSLALPGDVTGDGEDDVLISARVATESGVAFLFNASDVAAGGSSLLAVANWVGTGTNFVGCDLAELGDVDGDGIRDFGVGTAADTALIFAGGAWSGTMLASAATWSLTSPGLGGYQFGFRLGGPGDMDDDGYDDLVIGQRQADRVYFYAGATTGGAVVGTYRGAVGSEIGMPISTPGDVNADGFADLMLHGPFDDGGGPDAGQAVLITGDAGWTITEYATWNGEASDDWLGYAYPRYTGGDVDGDGLDEFLVSSPYNDRGGSNAGAVYLLGL